eukprot:7415375-Pyramimonas_sp.AAC.1
MSFFVPPDPFQSLPHGRSRSVPARQSGGRCRSLQSQRVRCPELGRRSSQDLLRGPPDAGVH